jgi:hypothetical protein
MASPGQSTTRLVCEFSGSNFYAFKQRKFGPNLSQFHARARHSLSICSGGTLINPTKTFPRFFVFGERYSPGDDYVRCDRPEHSVLVAPGVGEIPATDELSLDRCMSLVNQGRMMEADREIFSSSSKPNLQTSDRRQAAH